jgi:cytoskeleton protein RodZ
MNESMVAHSVTPSHDQYVQGVTAGGLLRDAREAAGVHIAALAVAMKIPVSKLEALESDDFSALPDIVFARALASSVCRTLKMDPGPVLALLPQGESPRLSANGAGLNEPVKGFRGKSSSASFAVPGSKPLVWAVGLLLIGAALIIFLPRGLEADLSALFKQRESNTALSTPSADIPQERSETVFPAPASYASATDVDVAVSTGNSIELAGVASPAAAVPSSAASESNLPASGVPAGVLAFKTRSESWIQVRDARGATVLQRNLVTGELVSVSGELPLAVVIGRADVTEVFVRGKPYELGPVSRENVARFEVK